jgi:lipopolysaccharide/colanic/teichoic acid biosynthesis glycosyltransferase
MELIIVHKNKNSTTNSSNGLLQFAISNEPITSVVFDGVSKNLCLDGDTSALLAIPGEWDIKCCITEPKIKIEGYSEGVRFSSQHLRKIKRHPWFIISNGRYTTQINRELLDKVLGGIHADVVTVNVELGLLAYRERVRSTTQGKVAGFRRLYSDLVAPASFPKDWPHHLLVKTNVLDQVLTNHALPQSFSVLLQRCRSNALTLRAINIGGTVLDLDTAEDLLSFLAAWYKSSAQNYHSVNNKSQKEILDKDGITISDSARLFGKILFGRDVSIGKNAIIVGPTIISNDVKIAQGAVIRASIVGPGVNVPKNYLIQNRVFFGSVPKREIMRLGSRTQRHQKQAYRDKTAHITAGTNSKATYKNSTPNNFRTWPRFSYARLPKRIVDIIAAISVLILFAPILPIIALAIKLSSRGPVFFKDTRQGLHGKEFHCLKFRTMTVGADKIQDKLRVVNQADGPQFKMVDDPRLSAVGRFLRDTYIDEIPQFLNVLLGQMSAVGPRPSPESENILCPSWRDARLSVRPGITGLWQVCRTRQPMKDFQEWIYYDTKYVKELSLRTDLWVCWQTVRQFVRNFLDKF